MTPLMLIFYFFSFSAVFSSTMVVISGNAIRSVLFLVLTFFSVAAIWLLLHAEFLSFILVLVYVGAVMTLFLFVLMMLRTNTLPWRDSLVRYLPWIALFAAMLIGLLWMALSKESHPSLAASPPLGLSDNNNLLDLGSVLYTDFVYPFEIAAIILLTAIVAAIALTHSPLPRGVSKKQSPSDQVKVQARDRVTLIKEGEL